MNQSDLFSHSLTTEIDGFILDRRARELSRNTIAFYTQELRIFQDYCHSKGIDTVEDLDPGLIKGCMLGLETHRNNGGIHALYRSVRAFLNWFDTEDEIKNWSNPIKKIKAPKINQDPRPGVTVETIKKLLNTCDRSYYGLRDKAIILFLYDTGLRVTELCDLKFEDINLSTGTVLVKHGKGNKSRMVFFQTVCRRELIKYLRCRPDIKPEDPLFSHKNGDPISRECVACQIDSRARRAKVDPPSPHDFRRAFTKESLKNADVLSVARLLGHSNTSLVWRYYYQNTEDLQKAHAKSSPVNNLKRALLPG